MADADATVMPLVESVVQQYDDFDRALRGILGQIDALPGEGAASSREAAGAALRREDPRPVITGVRESQRRGVVKKKALKVLLPKRSA
jgi:hypothetical protein